MSKIFISHSSTTNAAALAVAEWLAENGWDDYFLDVNPSRGLAPGERWQEALKAAAGRCEAVIFLVSRAWLDSRWCQAEYLLAKQLGKKVFGVLIEPTPLDSLPTEMTGEWQLCDLATGAERRVFRVRADPIVAATDVSLATSGLERLKVGLRKAGLDPATFLWPPPHDPGRAPYRGLKPLEPDDAAIFFGRDVAITRGLDVLRTIRQLGVERMFVILGASGAGKSSYLRAGLWPRLARDDRRFVPLPTVRPQGAAITGASGLVVSFDVALRHQNIARSRADIRDALRAPGGLVRLATELQQVAQPTVVPASSPPCVVLSIDQGEELFVSEGRKENDELLVMLSEALTPSSPSAWNSGHGLILVMAIRSDVYDRLQTEPHLAAIAQVPFNLSPIKREEFKHIITGPAERTNAGGRKLRIDPDLTERLLQDAEGADALPLLAFTLERLYVDHGGDAILSVGDYESLGGVRGSIEAAVQAAFADPRRDPVVPADQAACEQLLRTAFVPWLAHIDPDTEQRRRRVAVWEEIPDEARNVIERLVEARLLIRDRRVVDDGTRAATVVEVAHEAFLRQWPTLTAWLDEDADALKAAETVRRAAAEWGKHDRDATWLTHTGERLQTAERLRGRQDFDRLMGEAGRSYLLACRTRDDQWRADREAQSARIAWEQARTARAQRFARWVLASVAVILLLVGGGIVAQAREVARQRSRALIGNAEEAIGRGTYGRALRLALLASRSTWLSPSEPDAPVPIARAAFLSAEILELHLDDRVQWADFSPDGQKVITLSGNKTIQVFDARTGEPQARLVQDEPVSRIRFSGDGQRIVTASDDKMARVWDAQTGKELARMLHSNSVRTVAVNHDGDRIVTAAGEAATIWDARTGKETARMLHGDSVRMAAFNHDGSRIVTAAGEAATVWDARTGAQLARMAHDEGFLWSAVFSPDGNRILTASPDKTARLWDAATGKPLAQIRHDDNVMVASFSNDGQQIVTISEDKTAGVWDGQTGEPITRVHHDGAISSVDLSPDKQRIVTASEGAALIWDAQTGKVLTRMVHDDRVSTARFSPNGQQLVTASDDGTARIWDARIEKQVATVLHEDSVISTAELSPDGRRIATASGNTARVWDAQTGRPLARMLHDDRVWSAAFSSNGEQIVTASYDRTARVWDAQTGKELARLVHDDSVSSAAFSADGPRILTVCDDKTVRVWNAQTGVEVARMRYDDDTVSDSALSPERVLTRSDKTARVWDVQTGKSMVRLVHDAVVRSARFSRDGRRIVSASDDKTARIWNAQIGKEIARLSHDNSVSSAAWSPDGRLIVTASDRTAQVWDAQTATPIVRMIHDYRLFSAQFSQDGRRILSFPNDNTVRVWDAESGKELVRLPYEGQIYSAAFSPDQQWMLIASQRTARLWDTRWLSRYGNDLTDMVCRERLVGSRELSAADISSAPVLFGREHEDVCVQPQLFGRLTTWVRGLRQ